MTFEELWDMFAPAIAGLSHEYGSTCSQYGAEAADFRQEAACWMLAEEDRLSEKYDEIGDERRFAGWLLRCLRNEFNDYAVDIRAQAGGQDRTTAHWYSKEQIKGLLDANYADTPEPPVTEGGGRTSTKPEHRTAGNWMAMRADISAAVKSLSETDQDLLYARHFQERTFNQLADASDPPLTVEGVRQRYERIVGKMQEFLGGPQPDPMRPSGRDPWRGRHAIGNSHARHAQASLYDGVDN